MAPLTPELGRTCDRAHAIAAKRRARASATDFLLALIDDPDCMAVLDACAIDRAALRAKLEATLARTAGSVPNAGFLPILHRASEHLKAAGGTTGITGAHALIAIMRLPGTAGIAALDQHGLTRFDALRFVAHRLRKGESPPEQADTAGAATLAVMLMNDDHTPMEFVITVLMRFFDRDRDGAIRVMLAVHQTGAGTCGTYPAVVARAKAAEVAAFARKHEHPLCCVVAAVEQPSS